MTLDFSLNGQIQSSNLVLIALFLIENIYRYQKIRIRKIQWPDNKI